MTDELIQIVRRYQHRDERTGELTHRRTDLEFAALLGIHSAYLSRFYRGERTVTPKIIVGLLAAFPDSAGDVAAYLRARRDDAGGAASSAASPAEFASVTTG